jgi:prevent-host-death family protein
MDNAVAKRQSGRGFSDEASAFGRGGSANQSRDVQASVAKTHFSQLLDEVERGATITIVRHGRPIARIVPDAERRQAEVAEAIEGMKQLATQRAARLGELTIEEILSLRHEGHRY